MTTTLSDLLECLSAQIQQCPRITHLGQVRKSGAKTPVWTRFKCIFLPADSCSAAFGVHGVPSDGDAACVAFAISACVAGDAAVVVAAVVGLVPCDAGS